MASKTPKQPKLPRVTVRIYGVPAVRLRNLHVKTCVPMDRLAQMVFESSLKVVERRFR